MNIAIIMRGIPGSGKSTFVDIIKGLIPESAVHAVDDLHEEDGEFRWDESCADAKYLLNYANFIKSCSDQNPVVICDCINVDRKSVDQYVAAAKNFGYMVYVVTPDMPTPLESSLRNKHQVSLVQIKDMINRWESWPNKEDLL